MKLSGVLPFARELLQKAVSAGDVVIDGTAGNGHDTLFLAQLVGEHGTVYSFDIQQQAIESTGRRLSEKEAEHQVRLIHDGHEKISQHLSSEHYGKVAGSVFNLGYLPGSDKTVVTTPETTISAVEQVTEHLKPEGILLLVVYHGHPEGQVERDTLLPFVRSLPQEEFHVLEYRFTNQKNNPPFIIAVEKRKKKSQGA
ncbi:tRNA (mnm(5)s(2)U34)-methyltransferase [Evansella clarkii]|uniref:tRNA (mnm(5)s(2)U34)-methyltransferase n=1 Tax=Evansella clarkii TaxID=79879 RepID=UPI00099751FD|nr:class I SAM-dependent methyltransferase [Evansella clarkii]